MSMLFTVEGRMVAPTTETLMTPPFKEIWERDTSPNKEVAKQEFTYIEFVTSMKKSNPYAGYAEDIKKAKVQEDIVHIEGWKEDELIEEGIKKLEDFQKDASVTYTYYMAAKNGAEKMMNFFNTFSMDDVNLRSGNPLFKPREITTALNDTAKILENLNTMKDKVEQELFESTRKRGDKEVGHFAKKESL